MIVMIIILDLYLFYIDNLVIDKYLYTISITIAIQINSKKDN